VRAYSIVLVVALAACATQPKLIWLRTDGQRAGADPVLTQQFQIDKTVCLGQRERADLSGVTVTQGGLVGVVAAQNRANAADAVAQGCMAEKGYVLVQEDQARGKQEEFAAIAAEKARREAAALAPLSPPAQRAVSKPKTKAAPAPQTAQSQ
jgi:hypothetical protein